MFFHLVYEINRISAFARGSKTLSSQCICTKVLLLHYFPFWLRLESNPTPGWHKTIRKTHVGPRFTGLLARVPYYMSKVVLLMKSENQMHY